MHTKLNTNITDIGYNEAGKFEETRYLKKFIMLSSIHLMRLQLL